MKRNLLLAVGLLATIIGVAVAGSVLSNVFEGLIHVSSSSELIDIEAVAVTPEYVEFASPFFMDFTITNPNDFTINARLYIDFTLNGLIAIPTSAMSYPDWTTTNFTYTSGAASSGVSVSGNTWKFNAPKVLEDWFITIPTGTNTYRMQFQVNMPCDSINYAVWLAI